MKSMASQPRDTKAQALNGVGERQGLTDAKELTARLKLKAEIQVIGSGVDRYSVSGTSLGCLSVIISSQISCMTTPFSNI